MSVMRGMKLFRAASPVASGTGLVRAGRDGACGAMIKSADAAPEGQQVRWANLKLIRMRMRSVASIGKITKAMKMVAAAKLRSVQRVQEAARPFAGGMGGLFQLMENVKPEQSSEAPKELLIACTSDRGLCGGVNTQVVKNVKGYIGAHPNPSSVKLMLVGDKGRDGLQRSVGSNITTSFKDVFRAPVSFEQACIIAEDIMKQEYDKITLVYNKFKSAIAQEVTQGVVPGLEFMKTHAEVFDEYDFESDMDSAQVFVDLFEFKLATQLYSACLENGTSEQAARMSAMDNATRNAGDMLGRLTLTYNRQRQAVITSELIEIISGAEALKG